MKKRILGIALAICMMIFCVPMGVFAAEAPLFSGGTGTQEDPWLIASQADLTALAEFLNSGNAETFDTENAGIGNCHGYYFKQTADIDLTGVTWEPIGYSGGYYFAGNYDGGGHSITNAVSTGKVDPDGFATAGIFGWVAFGSVANLHVKNANFVATGQNNYSYVGGIAGVCYGSSIENCSVENSSLESRRNNNNNCAGSIVGYSTGGTFEKCAAENNQIRTMAYGGGFVGEVDDDPDYGAGNSTFTNCYTANCSVSSKTDDVQGVSLVGGFVGEMTDSALTVNNCYVYRAMLSTEGTAVPGIKATGVFAGHLWGGGSSIVDTNCFFGACGITENAGTASEKTEEEFRNGTVAGLLGDAFAQAGDYPKFNGPADYSSVDAAIAKANALEKDNYKDFSAVEAAINLVVPGKTLAEQAEVDAMAQAIENAITALQYKDADYTKVDEAIAKANALNKDAYTNFTAVESAINAVVRDKNITEQDEVDAMAQAIENAITALVEKPTEAPTATPTATPTAAPSASPTAVPTATPTATPTAAPSASPTAAPTATPTAAPSASPTAAPTATPTATPTAAPSASPTAAPTATPTVKPTAAPSASPTAAPTATPTAAPSASPTAVPTATPTVKPTATPTPAPKADPNNPKTGSSNLPVVFGSAALVLSGGALAAVLIYKKKRHEK